MAYLASNRMRSFAAASSGAAANAGGGSAGLKNAHRWADGVPMTATVQQAVY